MDGQPPLPLPPEPAQHRSAPPFPGPAVSLPPPPPPTGRMRGDRPFAMQPMGVGEILDAAIKLYRSRWKGLMAIVAIAIVPLEFLRAFLTRSIGSPISEPVATQGELDGAVIATFVLGGIEVLVLTPFLTAAVARASADVYLGHPVLVGTTFRFAVSRIHSILWISILSILAVALGFVLLIIPGLIVFFRFFFGPTVLVVEGKKGSKALGRSWRLAKGHFWKIVGTYILASIMAGVVAGVLGVPGAIAFAAIGPAGWPVYAVALSVASILTTPFTTLIAVLLYFDLRIRKEAFDLEVMAQELSATR